LPPPPCLGINDDWIEEEDCVVLCDGKAVDVGQLGGGEGSDHLKIEKNPDAMSSLYFYSIAEDLNVKAFLSRGAAT
jgi:hypothetical protein